MVNSPPKSFSELSSPTAPSVEGELTLFSPAKLNLFFRVLYRRGDGFHEIASLYQTISLGDVITVALAKEDKLTCDHPTLSCGASNLICRAVALFREQSGITAHYRIHLTKRIPMESGLGGGSSNAATVLWACNALTGALVSQEQLMEWGASLGSDVPFFFSEGTAYCRGRGEQLDNLPPLPKCSLWVAKPHWGLSTAAVYQGCQPTEFFRREPSEHLISISRLKEASAALGECCFNDLEGPAFLLSPALAEVKRSLLDLGFSSVTMTGSGSAFFCFGEGITPKLNGIDFYPVFFHRRQRQNWYEFPSF